ncbi:MAG: hypothetical protein GF308_00155 [Candidatus Heimdallarchaeota archaeon]|nr:hypothetical protein [Candidatus Heimdallarchaeota archaeon]
MVLIIGVMIIGFSIGGYYAIQFAFYQEEEATTELSLSFPIKNPKNITNIQNFLLSEDNTTDPIFRLITNSSLSVVSPASITITNVNLQQETQRHRLLTISSNINDRFSLNFIFSLKGNATELIPQVNNIDIITEKYGPENITSIYNNETVSFTTNIPRNCTRGENIGRLMVMPENSTSYIQIALLDQTDYVCPYNYFNETAKGIFDSVWERLGKDGPICEITNSNPVVCLLIDKKIRK